MADQGDRLRDLENLAAEDEPWRSPRTVSPDRVTPDPEVPYFWEDRDGGYGHDVVELPDQDWPC